MAVKFVRYAMTDNSAEVWTIALALLLLPISLLPIHFLWVNLVTACPAWNWRPSPPNAAP